MTLSLNDFKPINQWTVDSKGPAWVYGAHEIEPMFIIDKSTNRRYLNESKSLIRFKCFLLTIGTPLVHTVGLIVIIAAKAMKLLSLHHFWCKNDLGKGYPFKARVLNFAKDLSKVLLSPLYLAALELSCIWGMLKPLDGRKLYASFETLIYGHFLLAPCFQPEASYHAFGGDINCKNVF